MEEEDEAAEAKEACLASPSLRLWLLLPPPEAEWCAAALVLVEEEAEDPLEREDGASGSSVCECR